MYLVDANIFLEALLEQEKTASVRSFLESTDVESLFNEPKRVECGAPDYIITCAETPIGYVEAKDIGADLSKEERSDQIRCYCVSLNNLILTDYLEFRWYVKGEHRETVRLATVTLDGKVKRSKDGAQAVADLFQRFFAQEVPVIGRPQDLVQRMAALARMIRELIEETFKRESETATLHAQLEAFRETLIPDLTPEQFADMYAQTITYGLFAARVRVPVGQNFTREKAAWNLPRTNPFLRKLFNEIAGPDLDDRIAWLVDDLAYLLARADMVEILRDFGKRTRQEDPVVHFYETFLSAYNPDERIRRGVYYTPEPVVSYIVRSIDNILKTHFNRHLGLANKGEHIENLMKRYKSAVRNERNIQPLSDDYIKFIRFAHDRIERTGYGIIGMITNHSYLSGLIHRGMREELMKSFDEIYVLNLHGNALMKETAPDGGPDENVFDIRQGVAVVFMLKLGSPKDRMKK